MPRESIAKALNRFFLQQAKKAKVRGVDLPVVSNRAEARARLRGKGPFQFFGGKRQPSNRLMTTREKRMTQRLRAKGRIA